MAQMDHLGVVGEARKGMAGNVSSDLQGFKHQFDVVADKLGHTVESFASKFNLSGCGNYKRSPSNGLQCNKP